MKKILLCSILFLWTFVSGSAQIQRTFQGFEFGKSKRVEVLNYIKTKKWEFETKGNEYIYIKDMKFGGVKWPFTIFVFYDNIFYMAYFSDTGEITPRKSLDVVWDNLKRSFLKKYLYNLEDGATEDALRFEDKITTLKAKYEYFEGLKGISLMYYDKKLYNAQRMKEEDEL